MGYFGELSDVFTLPVIVLEDSANVIRYDATRFLGECSDVFTLSVMCGELQLMELVMLQFRYIYYVQGNIYLVICNCAQFKNLLLMVSSKEKVY